MTSSHQIIYIPIKQLNGGTIPILIVNENISLLCLTYIRELQRIGKSQSTILKNIQSIGLLWDYYFAIGGEKNPIKSEEFFKNFIELRINGAITQNGFDNIGLEWKPVLLSTAKIDLNNITNYFLFLEGNYNSLPINSLEKKFQNDIEFVLKKNIEKKYSFFNHIKRTEKSIKVKSFNRHDNTGKHTTTDYKAFPHENIRDLIKVANLRDKLIFLLLAYGGVRSSELFHIFINDISLNEKNGTANILLFNPVEGYIEWNSNGVRKKGIRKEFLMSKYGLHPRNQLSKKDKKFSGWKSMTEDNGKLRVSYVYWSNPDMGRLFYKLHLEYMKNIRLNANINHPYYFVSNSTINYGEEFTLNALKFQFNNYLQKIGLSNSIHGCNLHGLRHFYGYYCANILKVSKETAQRMLHHKNINSTEIYYQKTLESIEDELNIGYQNLKDSK